MATAAQTALARGFAALAGVAGESWTFDGETFSGVLGVLRIDDPRMAGATDRMHVLAVSASALSTRPKRGSILTNSTGRKFSVSRVDDSAGGTLEILVSQT